MATRKQALATLDRHGWKMDGEPDRDVWGVWYATVDPPAGMSIGGECRGCARSGDAPGKPALWREIIARVEAEAPFVEPCPDPETCDYHGGE